ncbi:MAG: dephospho-CoA kinase [Thiotrichales bacterium]|nr:dephospho-CoA kinase [Thiotrichales bacterium]
MAETTASRPLVIGLTGGIGSGKSAVADLFAEQGITVIDTDIIARQVVEPETAGLAAVVERFGRGVLAEDGQLDRARLRQQVFADEKERKALESILHPLIRTEMRRQVRSAASSYCIVCIPLLLETGQSDSVDRVLVVDTTPEQQVGRTLRRDGSPRETIEGILAAQASRQERLNRADDVIDNTGTREALKPQVAVLHREYLLLAASDRRAGARSS